MTCIVWDGKTLAADRRVTLGNLVRSTTKIRKIRNCLCGYAGSAAAGEELLAWFSAGARPDDYPADQKTENSASFLVIHPGGHIQKFEHNPFPINIEDGAFAIGSGADFALAAIYCGKSATEAVGVAMALDCMCGNGVDWLVHDDRKKSNPKKK